MHSLHSHHRDESLLVVSTGELVSWSIVSGPRGTPSLRVELIVSSCSCDHRAVSALLLRSGQSSFLVDPHRSFVDSWSVSIPDGRVTPPPFHPPFMSECIGVYVSSAVVLLPPPVPGVVVHWIR